MTPAVNLDWAGMLCQTDADTATDESSKPITAASDPIEAPTMPQLEYVKSKDPERFERDDRRWCCDCKRLAGGIRCKAPATGLLIASMIYEPVQTMPRRCVAYLPGMDDPDQTPGDARWPWLKDNPKTPQTDR